MKLPPPIAHFNPHQVRTLHKRISSAFHGFLYSIIGLIIGQMLHPFRLQAQTPQVIFRQNFENFTPVNISGSTLVPASVPVITTPIASMTNQWTTGTPDPGVNGTKCLYVRCTKASPACEDVPFFENSLPADISNSAVKVGIPSLQPGAKMRLKFSWRFPRADPDPQAGMKLIYSTDNELTWKEHPLSFFSTQGDNSSPADIPIDSTNFKGFKINSPSLKIGFRWFNSGSAPSDASVMVDDVEIIFEPTLQILAANPITICSGDSLSVGMNISGFPTGTAFSVQLSDNTDFGSAGTLSPNPVFSASGSQSSLSGSRKVRIPLAQQTGPYYVRLASSNGIFSENPIQITINKTPDKPFAGSETNVCSEPADPITIGSPNAETDVDYSWNINGEVTSFNELTPAFLTNNSLVKITKIVQVTASSGNGACVVQSDPMLVNIFPKPQISLAEGSDEMCQNSVQILRFLVQPKCPYSPSVICQSQPALCFINSPNATKLLNNDTAFVFNSAGLAPGQVNGLKYRHTFRWISTLACSTEYDFNITVAAVPEALAGDPETYCQGDTAKLLVFPPTGSGMFSRWEGTGVSPSGLFNPSANGIVIPGNQSFVKINLRRIVTKISGTVSCSDTAVKVVTIRKKPKLNPGVSPETICESEEELLLSNYSPIGSGNGPLNAGRWSGPGITGASAGINAPSPKFVVSNSTSQANILTYTYTDQFGCTADTTKLVFVLPNPPASAGNDRSGCSGKAIQIGSPSVDNYGYTWLAPPKQFFSGGNNTASTGSVTLINSGSSPDTVLAVLQVLHSASGCKNKDSLRIVVFPIPQASLQLPPSSQACTGDTILLRTNLAGLDTSNLNFQWLRNEFPITLTSPGAVSFPAMVSGSYQVKIGFAGAQCYDTSSAVQLNFNPVIKPKIAGDRTFCGNSPTTLRAVPADPDYQYEWKLYRFLPDTNLLAVPPVLLPGIPIAGVEVSRRGLLRVTLRTERGCADTSDLVQIDSLPKPEITNSISDTAFCNNVQVLFQAPVDSSPYYQYRWLDSANRNIVLSDSSKFFPKVAGTYFLDVYNKCGIATDTFRVIQVIPAPQFGILAGGRRDTTVCLNQNNSFDLVAPPGFQIYEWSYQDPVTNTTEGPVKSRILSNLPISLDTNYQVKLTIRDQFGCSNDDTIRVFVAQCQPRLFVPNAFLPTSNPLTEQEESNRVWFFDGYGIGEAKWYIYNRWGEMVASGNSWGEPQSPSDGRGWDGSFQKSGLPCPTGTYKYLIEYKGQKDNVTKKLAGNLTLIR